LVTRVYEQDEVEIEHGDEVEVEVEDKAARLCRGVKLVV